METINLSVISSLTGTIVIVFIYVYLYALYREHYMGLWASAWILMLSRYMFFDTGILMWKSHVLGVIIYQLIIIGSVSLFVLGIYKFINKSINRKCLYAFWGIILGNVVFTMFSPSVLYSLFVPIYMSCFIGIWVGYLCLKYLNKEGIGRLITGYGFILWSILSFLLPFSVDAWWFAAWGYLGGGVLRLTIAIGTLLAYFDKNRMELSLKEKEYRLLAENAVDIIYALQLSPKPVLKYISPAILAITGYPEENYYKTPKLLFDLILPEDQELLRNFLRDFPATVDTLLTLRLINRYKQTIWVEQKCVPLYDVQGNLIALQGIVRDITMRKKLEQMETVYDRMNMVGHMAATVAHEIRNPLTTVQGYLQFLMRKIAYKADRGKFELMLSELKRVDKIIGEYLSMSKQKVIAPKECSLNLIIENVLPLLELAVKGVQANIRLELTEVPQVLVDEDELRQLLLNMVRNGIEARPEGELIIGTTLEDGKVVLFIQDQGPGIPQEILAILGTPFNTTKDTGTGLGLPLCYRIAHRNHAEIKISTGSRGTRFSVYFNNNLI